MSDLRLRQEPLRIVPTAVASRPWRSLGGKGSLHLVERHARVYRHLWLMLLSGVAEPLFYLLSIGVGLGHLVGSVAGVSYTAYVAPALLGGDDGAPVMRGAGAATMDAAWRGRFVSVATVGEDLRVELEI